MLPSVKVNRDRPDAINRCNLFKLFSHDRDRPGYDEILNGACIVYLFREDIDAQLSSWERACRTGWWVNEVQGQPEQLPEDARDRIALARDLYRDIADVRLSYESMVADWDSAIASILAAAGWPSERITQARAQIQRDPAIAKV